ncbi:MAG: ATP-binding cassette domain-containing protein, partial [Thermodesulfobacteriota bacterium]
MNDILTIDKLSKSFGGVKAVSQVDCRVKQGELLGVIGPNGSGKTTFVNLITGFVKPSQGRIFFRDREITRLPPYKIVRLGITRTFQKKLPQNSTVS